MIEYMINDRTMKHALKKKYLENNKMRSYGAQHSSLILLKIYSILRDHIQFIWNHILFRNCNENDSNLGLGKNLSVRSNLLRIILTQIFNIKIG